ncbi:MFS transporter [Aurantiacibacter sediminis]|uniref:MFS transporter n=2 Tax=Aurantiacibacter sediminis TaxID=2793064 RepID=A0ABS0N6Q6_9SPHN|nr:MFS transporter [Aurantiacibacter sediminis]
MLGFVFSFFLAPLSAEFGWSRSAISMALFLIPASALVMPVVGALIDKHGGFRVVVPSILMLSAGYVLVTFVSGAIWTFYAALALTLVLGIASGPIAYSRAVAGAFSKARGMALALALSGSSISAILLPPAVEWLISNEGWRAGFLFLAAVATIFGLPAAWIGLRGRSVEQPSETKSAPISIVQHLRSRHLPLLMGAVFFTGLPVFGLVSQLRALLDDRGFSTGEAVFTVSLVGGAVLVGRIATGLLIDRIWAPGVAAAIVLLAMIGAVLLTQSDAVFWLTATGVFLIAMAQGAELDLIAFLTARYFGMEAFGRLYSFVYLAFAISLPVGATLFAASFDIVGSYSLALYMSAAGFALAAALFLALGQYPVAQKAET